MCFQASIVGVSRAVNVQECFLGGRIFMTLLDRLLVQTVVRTFRTWRTSSRDRLPSTQGRWKSVSGSEAIFPRKEIYRIGFFAWPWGRLCGGCYEARNTRTIGRHRCDGLDNRTRLSVCSMHSERFQRVLAAHGAVVVTSHMDCGIHAYPSDYWRFTPEAFARLLDHFPAKIVGYQGLSYNPFVVFGIGFKEVPQNFDRLAAQFRLSLNNR